MGDLFLREGIGARKGRGARWWAGGIGDEVIFVEERRTLQKISRAEEVVQFEIYPRCHHDVAIAFMNAELTASNQVYIVFQAKTVLDFTWLTCSPGEKTIV